MKTDTKEVNYVELSRNIRLRIASPAGFQKGWVTHEGRHIFINEDTNSAVSIDSSKQKIHLSPAEESAVKMYSNSGYDYSYAYVNHYLREGEIRRTMQEDKMKDEISNIDKAVHKNVLEKELTVYRGTALSEYGLKIEDLKEGVVLHDKAFTSTSKDISVAIDAYSRKDAPILEIKLPRVVALWT